VRAAYRALSLKYHPDRHATDPEATEMMALINSAYEVLSDSEKRRDYDDWIRFVESKPAREREEVRTGTSRDWIGIADPPGPSRILVPFTRFRHYWVFYILALAAIFVGSLWYESLYLHRSKALTPLASALSAARQEPPPGLNESPFARPAVRDHTPSSSNAQTLSTPDAEGGAQSERSPSQAPHAPPAVTRPARDPLAPPRVASKPAPIRQKSQSQSSELVAKHRAAKSASAEESAAPEDEEEHAEAYTRPGMAPNGESWPSSSDYIPGYLQRNTNGLSQVVIDNTHNRSDAYVKVVSVGDSEPRVVRNIFIQASDRFTVANLRAGTYEVRYQNLDSGRLLRSEVFALEESAIASGSRYSTVTLTLRTRADEAMNTFDLPKEQF
jgi:curved DNA-binding protein CbpA